jgi:protein-S-isoprenylcysteine O-methyltransferase Ste14
VHISQIFQPPLAIPFWIVFFFAFVRERRVVAGAMRDANAEQDQGTFRALMIGSSLALVAAFAVSFLPSFTIPDEPLAVWLGMVLLGAGAVLRRICLKTLGESFTGAVTVKKAQAIVERGPYRLVRHPSYTAAFMMFIGVGLALGSWISVLVLCAVNGYVYARRVSVEEAALLKTLGEPYRAYMSRTKRFIPFVV